MYVHVHMYPMYLCLYCNITVQSSTSFHSVLYLALFLLLSSRFTESTLPATAGQTSLHVFNHEPTGQAERGKTFYIFNVVQPTEANDIFSNELPNIATTNQREFFIINNVEVTDAVTLVVLYLAQMPSDIVSLGSLTTNITVIGEPNT